MKAMILAAGRGERLRPLTDTTPKPLLKINGKCLIEYHLINLQQAGFKEVVINVAWLGSQIMQRLGKGEKYQLNIRYSNEGRQALETGGGIANALGLLGDDPFLLVNGDICTDYPFRQLANFQLADMAHLVLVKNPEHNPQGDFSINRGRLQLAGNNKFTYSGLGIYKKDFFLEALDASKTGKFPLAPIIKKYISADKISGELYSGQWMDIGTQQRLDEMDRLLKLQN